MIDTHDWMHRLHRVRPRNLPQTPDTEGNYLRATTETLPRALSALWDSGVSGEQFFQEIEQALENFVDEEAPE